MAEQFHIGRWGQLLDAWIRFSPHEIEVLWQINVTPYRGAYWLLESAGTDLLLKTTIDREFHWSVRAFRWDKQRAYRFWQRTRPAWTTLLAWCMEHDLRWIEFSVSRGIFRFSWLHGRQRVRQPNTWHWQDARDAALLNSLSQFVRDIKKSIV